jgi:hypothetical protein
MTDMAGKVYLAAGPIDTSGWVPIGTAEGDGLTVTEALESVTITGPVKATITFEIEPLGHLPVTEAEVFSERTVADLEATKAVLIEHGWTQGALWSRSGRCVLGAMSSVSSRAEQHDIRAEHDRQMCLHGAFQRYLFEVMRVPAGVGIAGWNDANGRTFEEVMTALDGAIIYVKEKINA